MGGIGSNNFQVTLFDDGEVEMNYGAVSATGGLVGVTEGGGVLSTPTDFSVTGGGVIGDSPVELFDFVSLYDFSDPQTLVFVP